jgi:hypothetical protein
MSSRDPYAHLRANLALHRAVTAERTYVWWCAECQLHQADESGLCPLCGPGPVAGDVPLSA